MVNYAWPAEELEDRTITFSDRVATMSSDQLAILKLNMNRFYENMGIYSSVRSSTDMDAMGQFAEFSMQFQDHMHEGGLEDALARRAVSTATRTPTTLAPVRAPASARQIRMAHSWSRSCASLLLVAVELGFPAGALPGGAGPRPAIPRRWDGALIRADDARACWAPVTRRHGRESLSCRRSMVAGGEGARRGPASRTTRARAPTAAVAWR
jgi:hypothetical protein